MILPISISDSKIQTNYDIFFTSFRSIVLLVMSLSSFLCLHVLPRGKHMGGVCRKQCD